MQQGEQVATMEIRWLEDFIALAQTRHFSRAAEQQHVSQPTFSRRIRLLEETMGTTLINRQTLPLSLTPAGEQFLEFCERTTTELRATRERIAAVSDAAQSRLRIAAVQSLFSHFYPEWVEREQLGELLLPDLQSTNWIGADYIDALEQGRCDLALVYWHADLPWGDRLDPQRFRWHTLAQERLIPLSLAQQGQPRFELPGSERQPLPFIAYHSRNFIASAIAAHLRRTQPLLHLLPLNENTQAASVKTLIKQGYGVGWLPQRIAGPSAHYGQLVRAGDERWDIDIEVRLVALRDCALPALGQLWQCLESTAVEPSLS